MEDKEIKNNKATSVPFLPKKTTDNNIPDGLKNRNNNIDIINKNARSGYSSKNSDLEKKDGLEEKDNNLEDKTKTEKNEDNKTQNKRVSTSLTSGLNIGGNVKKKFKKIKLKLIIAGALLGFFLVALIIVALITSFNTLMTSIVGYSGISEDGDDGLWTNEEYFVDDNGNSIDLYDYTTEDGTTVEGLTTKLENSGNSCNINSIITYWFDSTFGASDFNGNTCRLLNYIHKTADKYKEDKGVIIDETLVISTIFYAYDEQELDKEDAISASEFHEVLRNILLDGNITKQDVIDIIDSMILHVNYTYYTYDSDNNNCKINDVDRYKVDLNKYKIYMRYGYVNNLANEYENAISSNYAYTSTSNKCKNNLQNGKIDITKYYDSIPQSELDSDVLVSTKYDYRDGFIYNKFTFYTTEDYDEVHTPKIIEKTLLNILERESEFDEVLTGETSTNSGKYVKGSSISGASINVQTYCDMYNSGDLNTIEVVVNDCNDDYIDTIPLKDYIIGVSYAETGYHPNMPDYNKTQIVAALSYALGRRNNYKNGNVLYMRSGDCDQNWCDVNLGCSRSYRGNKYPSTYPGLITDTINSISCNGKSGYWKCPMSSQAFNDYSDWYDEATNYVIYSDSKGFNGAYYNVVQNSWSSKAKNGENYVNILQESYKNSTIYDCSNY